MAEEKENLKEESFIIKYKKELLGGLLVLIAIIFFFKNDQETTFWYILGTAKAPLVVFIVMFYALGFITHYIISYFAKKELKNKIKDLEKGKSGEQQKQDVSTIKSLEEKIARLEKLLDKNNPTPPATPPAV